MVRRSFTTVLVALTLVAIANSRTAQATGYWNMPGTFCQWCGCGFGGGYHAPLVLGPLTHECFEGPNEIRIAQAPNPYACAPYGGGGCGGCNCTGSAMGPATPQQQQSQPEMIQPATNPQANRSSLIFNAPIQY
jgi:hypothetical protein